MRIKINIWFALCAFMILIILSCGGVRDEAIKLSGGYVYRVEGNIRYIIPDHIFHEGIYPNVMSYSYNDDFILVQQTPSRKYIASYLADDIITRYLVLFHAGEIEDLEDDEKEILANGYKQDSAFYLMLSEVLSPDNTAEDIKKSTEIAEDLLENNPYYSSLLENEFNYWIIDHSSDLKLGPMTKQEFEEQSATLVIPKSLLEGFLNKID